jgi:hypothetical protein
MIKGHITICKVYKDGTKETVLDRANMITAGLGSAFLDIQKGQGSRFPADYAPAYFQVGTGAPSFNAVDTSGFWYQVCAPLSWDQYGTDTDLDIQEKYRGFFASSINGAYQELEQTKAPLSSVVFSGEDGYFAEVVKGSVTKNFLDSFESQIVLDEKTANGLAITEIGLFARNPKGFYQESPLLMAYRSFNALNKTEQFSLVINWSIGFLGLDSNVDNHFHSGNRTTEARDPLRLR